MTHRLTRVDAQLAWSGLLTAAVLAASCSGRSSTTIVYQVVAGGSGNTAQGSGGHTSSGGQASIGGDSAIGGASSAGGSSTATPAGGGPAAVGGASNLAQGGSGGIASGGTSSGGNSQAGGSGNQAGGSSAAGSGGVPPGTCVDHPPDPLAPPCTGTGEITWKGHCYRFVPVFSLGSDSWTHAQAQCIAWGGNLVTVNCLAEHLFVQDHMPVMSVGDLGMIGAHRSADKQWHWANGEPWGYQPDPQTWEYWPTTAPAPIDPGYPYEQHRIYVGGPSVGTVPTWWVMTDDYGGPYVCERAAP